MNRSADGQQRQAGPAGAIEHRQQRRLAAQRAVHAHAVGVRALVEHERADQQAAGTGQAQAGPAPDFGEGIEPILKEFE